MIKQRLLTCLNELKKKKNTLSNFMNEFQFEQKKSFLHNKHQGKLALMMILFGKNKKVSLKTKKN